MLLINCYISLTLFLIIQLLEIFPVRIFVNCISTEFASRDSPWKNKNPEFLVPDSCCKTESPGCGVRDHPSNIPYTGCIHRFSEQLSDHLQLLGVVSLALALLQIFGVIFTSCLFSRYTQFIQECPFFRYSLYKSDSFPDMVYTGVPGPFPGIV